MNTEFSCRKSCPKDVETYPKGKSGSNGSWGFGMTGILLPPDLNGPLGFLHSPLAYNNQLANGKSPLYNSSFSNVPSYNEDYFKSISGLNGINDFKRGGQNN